MSDKRFVVQEDANTDKIILLIDYKRMKMYSFLAEEREAVNKISNYLNWFDECTDNYVVMLKEIEESNCEKSKEIAKLKREIVEQKSTIQRLEEENDKLIQKNCIPCELVNLQTREIDKLKEENEQLKSLINACEYGQKSLMEEMKCNDEALDKIWEIMKELYGVIDDE